LALPQRFLAHGSRADVLASAGLTAQDVARRVTEWVAALPVIEFDRSATGVDAESLGRPKD
jgi:1-deoxy-D-xylulose-5-phosphate synthase